VTEDIKQKHAAVSNVMTHAQSNVLVSRIKGLISKMNLHLHGLVSKICRDIMPPIK